MKYNDITLKYACSDLNKMLTGLRVLKNSKKYKSVEDMCNGEHLDLVEVQTFLDHISNKYKSMIEDKNSFGRLISENILKESSLRPLTNIGIHSLSDLAEQKNLDEFCQLDLRPATKVKILNIMIKNELVFKDSDMETMTKLYNLISCFV